MCSLPSSLYITGGVFNILSTACVAWSTHFGSGLLYLHFLHIHCSQQYFLSGEEKVNNNHLVCLSPDLQVLVRILNTYLKSELKFWGERMRDVQKWICAESLLFAPKYLVWKLSQIMTLLYLVAVMRLFIYLFIFWPSITFFSFCQYQGGKFSQDF